MDLTGRLDEILQVRARQKIPQADELAMVFIFYIDNSPPVLSSTHRAAAYNDVVLRADNGERDEVLDGRIHGALFFVLLVVVVWVHAQVVENKLFFDAFFESVAFFECQRVGFGDDRNYIDHIRELFEDYYVDWLEAVEDQQRKDYLLGLLLFRLRMPRRLNKEETAMDAGILDVSLSLCRKLLS